MNFWPKRSISKPAIESLRVLSNSSRTGPSGPSVPRWELAMRWFNIANYP